MTTHPDSLDTHPPLELPATLVGPRTWLSKEQLCADLGLDRRTVERLMQRGLPHLCIGTRRTRFDREAVRQWLTRNFGVARQGKSKQGEEASRLMAARRAAAIHDAP